MDLTPTWECVMEGYLERLRSRGTSKKALEIREGVENEMRRLARIADELIAQAKQRRKDSQE